MLLLIVEPYALYSSCMCMYWLIFNNRTTYGSAHQNQMINQDFINWSNDNDEISHQSNMEYIDRFLSLSLSLSLSLYLTTTNKYAYLCKIWNTIFLKEMDCKDEMIYHGKPLGFKTQASAAVFDGDTSLLNETICLSVHLQITTLH